MIRKYITLFILFVIIFKIDAQQSSIKNITIENGLPSNNIFDLEQDQIGYLWIATDAGLVKYDGNEFKLINKRITTALNIYDDVIYAGTENGLFIKSKTNEEFLKSKKVLKVYTHDSNIYIGTLEGIFILSEHNLKPLKLNTTLDFSIINDILYCDNSYFIATNNGLWVINDLSAPNSIEKIIDKNIVSLTAFQSQVIASSIEGELYVTNSKSILKNVQTIRNVSTINKIKNELWVCSKSEGIEIFTLPSFSFKQKINKYNSLSTNTTYSVFRDVNNSSYITSNNGLYILNSSIQRNRPNLIPIVHFENLQINHENFNNLLLNNRAKLSSIQNNISVSFKTVNLLNPYDVKYRYSLNDQFSPWLTTNTVQYPKLNSGNYTFKIQSKINSTKSKIKSFSFSIDKPFYEKAWFYFVTGIGSLLIGYFTLHYYILKINKVNKEKLDKLKLKNRLLSLEQKALQLQMNPHFIFNVLNGIKALGNAGKTNELNNTISKFSMLLRGILNNSRKEEISLFDELSLLKNYIELEQRMSTKSFSYKIFKNLNNIDTEEIIIPTMLIQPFVENSIKHAFTDIEKGKIEIHFDVEFSFLKIQIIDNGSGIHQTRKKSMQVKHKSIALKVSKERLQNITPKNSFKAEEIFEKNKVTGTKISFKIPLITDY